MALAEQKFEVVVADLLRCCSDVRRAMRAWARQSGNAELKALLVSRARFYLHVMTQLKTLRAQNVEARCIGPMLNPCGRRGTSPQRRRLMISDQRVLNACEREEARVLMRYRDALDFELPVAAAQILRGQFGIMLDQHANLQRRCARVRSVDARILAFVP